MQDRDARKHLATGKVRTASAEARNAALEAKGKGHGGWSTEHVNKQDHDRETPGIELSEYARTIPATAVFLMISVWYSL